MMIVRIAAAFSLLAFSAAAAQTPAPRSAFPNAPLCSSGPGAATFAGRSAACPSSVAAPVAAQACNGRGRFVAGRCLCSPGWAGSGCETPAPVGTCSGHGEMLRGRCICSSSWMGPDCSTAGLSITGRFFR